MSDTDPGIRVKPRRRLGIWRVPMQFLLGIAAFSGLSLLILSLVGFSVQLPGALTERIESRVNAGLEAGRVGFGRTSISLSPGESPMVLLEDVEVFGGDDAELAQLNTVRMRLAPRQLLRGSLAPDEIGVTGAQITLRRDREGAFALTFGPDAGASGSPVNWLAGLDQALRLGPLAQLSSLDADNLTITVVDGGTGRRWQAEESGLKLRRTADGLDLGLAADFFDGHTTSIPTTIRLRTGPKLPSPRLTATAENMPASVIAAQSPALAFLESVEAPISFTLATSLGATGEPTDISGSLEVGQGVLRISPEGPPMNLGGFDLRFAYDLERRMLDFTDIEVDSEFLTAVAEGTAILQVFEDRTPSALVGQIALSGISLNPRDLYSEPPQFEAGTVDFRIRLDPFWIDIGQMTLRDADLRVIGRGHALVMDNGWDIAVDVGVDTLPINRLNTLWPASMAPGFLGRLSESLTAGRISGLRSALRITPGQTPKVAVSSYFQDVTIDPGGSIPPVLGLGGYASLDGRSAAVSIEKGALVPPAGGEIDIAGTVLTIGDIRSWNRMTEVTLLTESTITSVLSLLELPPIELLSGTDLEADLADGRAKLRTGITFNSTDESAAVIPSFEISGQLLEVVTDTLVRNRRIEAPILNVRGDSDGISVGGTGLLGQVPVNATWSQNFGPGNKGKSRVEGSAELSERFLDEFALELPPDSLTGDGLARIVVDMTGDGSPAFELESDLAGVGLQLKALGWSKPPEGMGALEVVGQLGAQATVERLSIKAPGLSASGTVEFAPDMELTRARFDRVTVGDWFDGPLDLIGRGVGLPPSVAVTGGEIDLRSARLDVRGDGRGGPMTLALDRLVVSDNVTLTNLAGEFTTERGLEGGFTATINGRPTINGTVMRGSSGSAIRITSGQAGSVLQELGLIRGARGGKMTLSLVPAGERGVYDGRMNATGVRIFDAPAITKLLSAITVVGLLDQLSSGGITMSKVEADFQLTPDSLVLHASSAVGLSLGISLDGLYDMENRRLDMQGVISPVYFLNSIGQVFTRGGEGLFGFTFKLTGDASDPQVGINPLSILTPGMFREIFRGPPPSSP